LKLSLRSTFAALLAALAFACAGLGDRGPAGEASGGRRAPSLQRQTRGGLQDARETLALPFLRGGSPGVAGASHRTGALPRVGPGTHPSDPSLEGTAHAARRAAAGARIRTTRRPSFARQLAAARDGTLSARSNGVPPPALA
jgi:hypothetical protein